MLRGGWRIAAFVVLALCVPGVARAATINVTTTQDVIAKDGACSLREAVISANTDSSAASGGDCVAGSGNDTIVLPAGTYRLTLKGNEDSSFSPLDNDATVNDLDVTSSATIQGAAASSTIVDANGIDRAFDTYASVQLEDLTITGGRAQNTGVNRSDDGGGVRAAANLVVTDCAFVDNQAAAGRPGADATGAANGGIALAGTGSPGGNGGAVYAEAGLTVTGTSFKNNVAGAGGASGNAHGGAGAISSASPTGVDGGGAGAFAAGAGGAGGAIWAGTGALITASTFVANTAGAGGTGGSATGGLAGVYVSIAQGAPPPKAGAGGGALGGSGGAGGAGGAVYVAAGSGTIAQSTFTANHSGVGGDAGKATGGQGQGLFSLSGAGGVGTGGKGGDGGDGGAIASTAGTGTLKLTDSTLSGNTTGAGGAGGVGVGGSAFDNTPGDSGSIAAGAAQGGAGGAGGDGGGVAVAGGGNFLNDTMSGNATGAGGAGGLATPGTGTPATAVGGVGGLGGNGGGIADIAAGSQVEIQNLTLSNNTNGATGAHGAPVPAGGGGTIGGGGALARIGGTISVAGSIFSGNEAPGCFSATAQGSISDGAGNVRFPAADSSCPGTVGDPGLASLADNGGPVPTQAIAAGSAAIGAAPAAGCPPADARGVPRPTGKACDAGAFELAPPTAATGPASTGTTGGSSGKTSPKLTAVGLSASTFAVTAKPTARTSRTSAGIPLGTIFHLKLSENASALFTFTRKTTTRKGKKKAIHYSSTGTIAHSFKAGSHTFPFTGWIGGKPLPPGSYRVSISATDAAKHRSKAFTLTFTIVRSGA